MAEKQFGLPREERVRRSSELDRIFREGRRLSERFIYVRYMPNGLGITRMAVAVPGKFGKAVRRNRAKRLFREAFRLHKHEMPRGLDIVFLPGRDWDNPPLSALEEGMTRIAGRLTREMQGSGHNRPDAT